MTVENELPGQERRNQRVLEVVYAAFLMIAVGRIGELIPGFGSLPLAKVVMGIGAILLLAKWKHLQHLAPVSAPLLRAALGLVALAVITAPFSVWPGNTLEFFYLQLPVMAVGMIVCWKISYKWTVLRGVLRVLVIAGVVLAGMALKGFHGGRASTTESMDPNDLAYVLVSVAPLALGFALTATTKLKRLVNAGACALLLVALLLTSSRGGFFGLIAALVVLVLVPIRRPQSQSGDGKKRNRIILPALGVVCAFIVLWAYLPAQTRERLATVTELGNDYNMDSTNKNGREAIWGRGFRAALERPVGYGILTYPMVDLSMGGQFRAPHNSYLEVLVELGFLGILLFARMYVLSWRTLQRARASLLAAPPDDERNEILVFARMLQVALVGNAVAGFFLSTSYSTLLWVLFAVVMTCVSLVDAALPTPVEALSSEVANPLQRRL